MFGIELTWLAGRGEWNLLGCQGVGGVAGRGEVAGEGVSRKQFSSDRETVDIDCFDWLK